MDDHQQLDFWPTMSQLRNRPATCQKRIIIFEGPAGSGKTSLIKQLRLYKQFQLIPRPPYEQFRWSEVRAYEWRSHLYSLIKDDYQMMHALVSPDPVCVLDRWALSQWVYEGIRNEDFRRNERSPQNYLRNHVWRIGELIHHLELRGWQNPWKRIDVQFMLLLPTWTCLSRLRKRNPQKYTYSQIDEMDRYALVSSVFKHFAHIHHNIFVTGNSFVYDYYQLDNLELLDKVRSFV